MAAQADSGGKDEVKTQFTTREGTYRLMTLSEYSRPNRVGYSGAGGASHVRVSLVSLPPAVPAAAPASPAPPPADPPPADERICFNHGKELYVYVYRGIKKAADLTKPLDKKMYKGTNPTCHDFNTVTMTSDSVSLIIGFSTGQIQLIDPIKKEIGKLYNEERLIDKTKVTCIKWVPGSSNLFVCSHASGQLYVYNEELGCGSAAPHYQLFKQGDGYSVHTCRTKSTRNPLYRWVVGAAGSCINEFAFSPSGAELAVASQDGFLRVFNYDTMEVVGRARSYFGGFLCVCWSPDGRYVVVGGEDDLLTVWCVRTRRVAARAMGHRSWVSVVAFDPFVGSAEGGGGGAGGEDGDGHGQAAAARDPCYRLGSVSHDTQLCLWDLTEDVLRPPARVRASAHLSPPAPSPAPLAACTNAAAAVPTYKPPATATLAPLSPNGVPRGAGAGARKAAKLAHKHADLPQEANATGRTSKGKANSVATLNISVGRAKDEPGGGGGGGGGALSVHSLTARLAGFSFGERRDHRRNFSLSVRGGGGGEGKAGAGGGCAGGAGAAGGGASAEGDPLRLVGTPLCPRFDECPVLEPLVCKKVAHERLTALLFRPDYFVTACADGTVNTWARPAPAAAPPALAQARPNGEARHPDRSDRLNPQDRPPA